MKAHFTSSGRSGVRARSKPMRRVNVEARQDGAVDGRSLSGDEMRVATSSPLTDSNRRRTPYHAIQTATVAVSGNGFAPDQAVFALPASRTFATGCAPSVPSLFHPINA